MAATVTVSESNGSGETVTNDTTNVNMGSTDAVNLVAADYPVTAGTNSFEKWQRLRCSAAGGSSKIKTFKVWASAALSSNCTHKTNAREGSYAGAETYAQPSASDRNATYHYSQTMPTTTPSGANLGYGGSLAGEMDVTSGLPKYSDYLVSQVQTTGSATAGTSVTMSFQYDEVA